MFSKCQWFISSLHFYFLSYYSRVAFNLDVAFDFGQEDDRKISIVAYRTGSGCGGQMVRGDFT
jgi:hypothetical protein